MERAALSFGASLATQQFLLGGISFPSTEHSLMVAAGFAAAPYVYPMLNYPISFIDSQPYFFPIFAAVGTYVWARYM